MEFENRWHVHLLAKNSERGRALSPGERSRGGGSKGTSPTRGSASRSRSVSPLERSMSRDTGGISLGETAAATKAVNGEQKPSSSLMRATRLFRRSMSTTALLAGGEPPSPQRATSAAAVAEPSFVSLQLFKTVSSIGSALTSLGTSGAGATNGSGGSGMTSAFYPKEGGEDATPPSAKLTPASPASTSSAFEHEVESRAAGAARTPWATATAATAAGVPTTTTNGSTTNNASSVCGGGASATSSPPFRHAHLGRDGAECSCGAAALYREVMEASGQVMAVTVGREAVKAAEAKAELEAKAKAAHKLLRAQAYAHLLTRVAKAVAYADLQVSSSEQHRRSGSSRSVAQSS